MTCYLLLIYFYGAPAMAFYPEVMSCAQCEVRGRAWASDDRKSYRCMKTEP